MLIRYGTEKEQSIANFVKIRVASAFGGKKKFMLSGMVLGSSSFTDGETIIAYFDNKESAFEVIDKIAAFFEENPNGIFKIGQ